MWRESAFIWTTEFELPVGFKDGKITIKKDGWILKPSPQERHDQRNQYRNMSMLYK